MLLRQLRTLIQKIRDANNPSETFLQHASSLGTHLQALADKLDNHPQLIGGIHRIVRTVFKISPNHSHHTVGQILQLLQPKTTVDLLQALAHYCHGVAKDYQNRPQTQTPIDSNTPTAVFINTHLLEIIQMILDREKHSNGLSSILQSLPPLNRPVSIHDPLTMSKSLLFYAAQHPEQVQATLLTHLRTSLNSESDQKSLIDYHKSLNDNSNTDTQSPYLQQAMLEAWLQAHHQLQSSSSSPLTCNHDHSEFLTQIQAAPADIHSILRSAWAQDEANLALYYDQLDKHYQQAKDDRTPLASTLPAPNTSMAQVILQALLLTQKKGQHSLPQAIHGLKSIVSSLLPNGQSPALSETFCDQALKEMASFIQEGQLDKLFHAANRYQEQGLLRPQHEAYADIQIFCTYLEKTLSYISEFNGFTQSESVFKSLKISHFFTQLLIPPPTPRQTITLPPPHDVTLYPDNSTALNPSFMLMLIASLCQSERLKDSLKPWIQSPQPISPLPRQDRLSAAITPPSDQDNRLLYTFIEFLSVLRYSALSSFQVFVPGKQRQSAHQLNLALKHALHTFGFLSAFFMQASLQKIHSLFREKTEDDILMPKTSMLRLTQHPQFWPQLSKQCQHCESLLSLPLFQIFFIQCFLPSMIAVMGGYTAYTDYKKLTKNTKNALYLDASHLLTEVIPRMHTLEPEALPTLTDMIMTSQNQPNYWSEQLVHADLLPRLQPIVQAGAQAMLEKKQAMQPETLQFLHNTHQIFTMMIYLTPIMITMQTHLSRQSQQQQQLAANHLLTVTCDTINTLDVTRCIQDISQIPGLESSPVLTQQQQLAAIYGLSCAFQLIAPYIRPLAGLDWSAKNLAQLLSQGYLTEQKIVQYPEETNMEMLKTQTHNRKPHRAGRTPRYKPNFSQPPKFIQNILNMCQKFTKFFQQLWQQWQKPTRNNSPPTHTRGG